MCFQNSHNQRKELNFLKHLILPLFLNLISILIIALTNKFDNGTGKTILFDIVLLGGTYFFIMIYYLPVLIVIQFLRGERIVKRLIHNCMAILLWSFVPLAVVLIIIAIVSAVIHKLPWSVFSGVFSWGKAIIIPLSLFYFYKKFSKESFYDSLIDSMSTCGFVLLLTLLGG